MSYGYTLHQPTGFSCPECGGALAKVESDPLPKYACHIGHVLTGEAMLETQAERIEEFLTSALAALNERRELCRQLIEEGISDGARLHSLMNEATEAAVKLRDLLNGQYPLRAVVDDHVNRPGV
jgi:two-component system chemotaxis response regulator CheB